MDPAGPPGGGARAGAAGGRAAPRNAGARGRTAGARAGEDLLQAAVLSAEFFSSGLAMSHTASPRPFHSDLPRREPESSRRAPSPVPSLTPQGFTRPFDRDGRS